ncbi:MAG: RpiB/LacA/LacB family sugar-phosphate isomerase [Mariniphaga sp.]|nr:RpiB/LacA/LacB family sugar-phosphate isomerase [Mariniphaga sp.]
METRSYKKKTGSKTRELMRIGIATDFGWFELKAKLTSALKAAGYEIADIGAYELVAGDTYPDFVVPLAKTVSEGEGIQNPAVRNSVKACAAANKIPGVRASLISDSLAYPKVKDNNLYVMCLGGQIKGYALSTNKVMTFPNAYSSANQPINQNLARVKVLNRDNKRMPQEKYVV